MAIRGEFNSREGACYTFKCATSGYLAVAHAKAYCDRSFGVIISSTAGAFSLVHMGYSAGVYCFRHAPWRTSRQSPGPGLIHCSVVRISSLQQEADTGKTALLRLKSLSAHIRGYLRLRLMTSTAVIDAAAAETAAAVKTAYCETLLAGT